MIHKKENVNLPGLSQKELKILKKIRKYAYRLDYSGCYFCCEIRLGWSAIIGMIPIIGDIINLYLSIRLINRCINIKIPKNVIIQMYINIFIAFLIGTIPMIGDMLFIYYKCNIRNYILLEKTLKEREKIAFELTSK
ncbi:hypothetical protein PCANB_002003 [Pneumocystis canis]|nr:hypothetical protein PCANB_002003 [Pneumocystis canis]